jgi:hypothetical protein
MSPAKASLTTSQGVSAIIAGIVGHFLFSLAWFTLILGVLGLVARNVLFGLLDTAISQIELTGEAGEGILGTIEAVRGALGTLNLVLIISSAVSIVIAFLISGGIMKAGGVRKPFGATFAAMVIAGILDLGLFWVYLFIGLNASEETGFFPTYPIAFVIGTVVIGALVWLWMAHLRRPLLSDSEVTTAEQVGSADGSPVVVAPQHTPVLDHSADPPAVAPVADPVEAEVAAAEPSTVPAAKKPTTKKPTTSKTPTPPTGSDPS